MKAEWNCDEFLGYLETWSAVQKYAEQKSAPPLEQVEQKLRRAWGSAAQVRQIRWPLYLRVGHIGSR